MAFETPIESYNGKIREVSIGAGDSARVVGGENSFPFHLWEGQMVTKPAIAMEVYDIEPQNWPPAVIGPFSDVLANPVAWAKKCQGEYGADMICLQLLGTDPNGENRTPEEAAQTVKSVVEAVSIPVIVYGSGNVEKDAEVLKKVAEVTQGSNLLLGPAVEDNYKSVVAPALAYKHSVAGQTPIDVNMAKQLNILMTQLGQDASKIVIDPSTGALGYGLEYTYSVIERLKSAALQQNDDMTQMPIISNLGKEAWRAKEAKTSTEEEPAWGDEAKRGVLWETITAVSLLVAGADILIMRHPEAVKLVKRFINKLMG
jgi:acetyl-CoA decarbonylase/synthase complex subunit delta